MTRIPPTADDCIRILSEWAKGRTYPEIAADLGLAENAVENVIKCSFGPIADKAKSDHVTNMTARKSVFYTGKRKDADRDAIVITKWLDGMSAGKIGKELGITTNTVIGIVHRSKVKRSHVIRKSTQSAAQSKGCATKLAKSERQRDETAQAMVERRRTGTLLRQSPQLELVASTPLPRDSIEPPFDPYAHLLTEGGLRRALADMVVPRDIISEQHK